MLSPCFQPAPSLDTLMPRSRSTRPGCPATPVLPWNPAHCPGNPRQDRRGARSGEDSLLCPGIRSARPRRTPPTAASRGRRGSQCHPQAGSLTCRSAGPGDGGEKRGDPQRPQQAPALPAPPARSGQARESEASGKGRGGRGTGTRIVPGRHLAGLRSPEGAAAPLALPAGNKGGAGQRPRRAGSRLLARALSHSRSETRLRRALRSPARRAPTRAATAHSRPGMSPRPFPPRRTGALGPPLPPGAPYVTLEKSPTSARVRESGRGPRPPSRLSLSWPPRGQSTLLTDQWNPLNGPAGLEAL